MPQSCPKMEKVTKKAPRKGLKNKQNQQKIEKITRKMLISVRNEHFLVDDQGLEAVGKIAESL